MTIAQAIAQADKLKPNLMDTATKIAFLNQIENIIWDELVMAHEHEETEEVQPDYDAQTSTSTELIVPVPYDMVYVYWLMAQMDHQNMEYEKYNNDYAMFTNMYDNLSNWWIRHKRPIPVTGGFRI